MRNNYGRTKNKGYGDQQEKKKLYKYLRDGSIVYWERRKGKREIQNDSQVTGLVTLQVTGQIEVFQNQRGKKEIQTCFQKHIMSSISDILNLKYFQTDLSKKQLDFWIYTCTKGTQYWEFAKIIGEFTSLQPLMCCIHHMLHGQ